MAQGLYIIGLRALVSVRFGKTITYGGKRKERVWRFLAAIQSHALQESAESQGIKAQQVQVAPQSLYSNQDQATPGLAQLEVRTTLKAMKAATENMISTDVLRMIHNCYLPRSLDILRDLRPVRHGRKASQWHFYLILWDLELGKNQQYFDYAWECLRSDRKIEFPTPPSKSLFSFPPLPRPILQPESPQPGPAYVSRSHLESLCTQALAQPGALLRIKAPQKMGKTWLINRVINQMAHQSRYAVARVSCKLADRADTQDLDAFLRWLCSSISQQLDLPLAFSESWDETILGSKQSCTIYLERWILAKLNQPLLLCLDDVDLVFPHPEIRLDFFSLLRVWHERASSQPIWQNLRLVIVHATDIYTRLKLKESPFNVGVPVEVPPLTAEEVHKLGQLLGQELDDLQIEQLMVLLNGHPYLVHLALSQLRLRQDFTFEQLLQTAPTDAGIYSGYLRERLAILQQNPYLAQALQEVMIATEPVKLETITAHFLHSIGLVTWRGNKVRLSCELYRLYFQDRLED